jgi:hypothetical protein
MNLFVNEFHIIFFSIRKFYPFSLYIQICHNLYLQKDSRTDVFIYEEYIIF